MPISITITPFILNVTWMSNLQGCNQEGLSPLSKAQLPLEPKIFVQRWATRLSFLNNFRAPSPHRPLIFESLVTPLQIISLHFALFPCIFDFSYYRLWEYNNWNISKTYFIFNFPDSKTHSYSQNQCIGTKSWEHAQNHIYHTHA